MEGFVVSINSIPGSGRYLERLGVSCPIDDTSDEAESMKIIFYFLGEIQEKIDEKKFDEAINYISELEKHKLIATEPLISFLFYEQKALCFKIMGRVEDALVAENQLISDLEKMEGDFWAGAQLSEHLLERATLNIALGKNEEAIADLRAFLKREKIGEVETIALFKLFEKKLGVTLLSPENAKEGTVEFLILQDKYEEALGKIPSITDATCYYERSMCYALGGRFEEARQCYEELRLKRPTEFDEFNTVYPHFEATLCYLEGDREKAVAASKDIDLEIIYEKHYLPCVLFFDHL